MSLIVTEPINITQLKEITECNSRDLMNAVVDIEKAIIALNFPMQVDGKLILDGDL